jgi:transcriptional regulator with XRE-family HTH domain
VSTLISKTSESSLSAALAEQLRNVRSRRGLSQKQLARTLGVSQAMISRAEAGDCLLPLAAMEQLAASFQVSAHDLFPVADPSDLIHQVYGAWSAYQQARTAYQDLLHRATNMSRTLERVHEWIAKTPLEHTQKEELQKELRRFEDAHARESPEGVPFYASSDFRAQAAEKVPPVPEAIAAFRMLPAISRQDDERQQAVLVLLKAATQVPTEDFGLLVQLASRLSSGPTNKLTDTQNDSDACEGG